MTNPDENFLSLSKLDNHIASFTANLEDGSLLDSTHGITRQKATATHKLLQNVILLLAKQREKIDIGSGEGMGEEKKRKEDNSLDVLNSVSVQFQDCNYAFTISDDKIYGIKRANEA